MLLKELWPLILLVAVLYIYTVNRICQCVEECKRANASGFVDWVNKWVKTLENDLKKAQKSLEN